MIDSRKVRDRRHLKFNRLEEALGETETLAEAERRGTLRATGNWALGQAIAHLAYWARAPLDGYPPMARPPWIVRKLVPLFKKGVLNKRMPVGIRIPGAPDGTFGVERMETDRALDELRSAYARLARQAPEVPNPLLGPLAHDDWIKLNLRHAELHLGFFHAE